MLTESEAIELQKNMSKQVILDDKIPQKVTYIGGVDVGYLKNSTKAVAVSSIVDICTMNIVETTSIVDEVTFPYIPGLFRSGNCHFY